MLLRKSSYLLLAIAAILMIFIITKNFSSRNSYFIPPEVLNPTDIEQVEILNIAANEVIRLTQQNEIEEIASFFSALNTGNSDGVVHDEPQILYHIYFNNVGYYPGPPISIAENAIIYHNEMMNVTTETITQLESIIRRGSHDAPVTKTED